MPVAAALPAIIGAGASIGGGLLNRRAGDQRKTGEQYQFDPAALGAYQGLQPQIASNLADIMQDPWKAGYFQKAYERASEQAGAHAQQGIQSLFNPALGVMGGAGGAGTGAVANPSAFIASELGRIQRGASRERGDALTNLLLGAQGLRQSAIGQALSYRPLQTGGTGTTRDTKGSIWGDLLGGAGNLINSFYPQSPRSMGAPSPYPSSWPDYQVPPMDPNLIRGGIFDVNVPGY